MPKPHHVFSQSSLTFMSNQPILLHQPHSYHSYWGFRPCRCCCLTLENRTYNIFFLGKKNFYWLHNKVTMIKCGKIKHQSDASRDPNDWKLNKKSATQSSNKRKQNRTPKPSSGLEQLQKPSQNRRCHATMKKYQESSNENPTQLEGDDIMIR